MAHDTPELAAHKEWLGQIQQVGLVVSPHVLVRHTVLVDRQKALEVQRSLADLDDDARTEDVAAGPVRPEAGLRREDFATFASSIFDWWPDLLLGLPGGRSLLDALTISLPEHEDTLAPDLAIPDPEDADALPLALVNIHDAGIDFDALPAQPAHGWRATPHARLERLLRETKVPIGLLFNGAELRLVYAPSGESSGHLTFRVKDMVQTMGRPMAGALHALLGEVRVTDALPESQRLPALLRESRRYQNEVSTELADQVLEALWELVRGFRGVTNIVQERDALDRVRDVLAARARGHRSMTKEEEARIDATVRARVSDLLDSWHKTGQKHLDVGSKLRYQPYEGSDGPAFLHMPLDPELATLPADHRKFKASRSLRDVEPVVNLWIKKLDGVEIDMPVEGEDA